MIQKSVCLKYFYGSAYKPSIIKANFVYRVIKNMLMFQFEGGVVILIIKF